MIKQFVKAIITRSYYLNCLVFKMYDTYRRFSCLLSKEGAKLHNFGAAKIKKDVIGKTILLLSIEELSFIKQK